MNSVNKIKESSFFFRGYVFEITTEKIKVNGIDLLKIINFLKSAPPDLDVKSFIHYSFNLSLEQKVKKGNGIVFQIEDIFCEPAIRLFLSKKDLKKNYLSKYDFSFLNDFEFDLSLANQEDESNRALYYNEERGLLWCVSNTNGYDKNSTFCKGCINKAKCLTYKVKNRT